MADEAILVINDDPSVRDAFIRFVQVGSYRACGASSAMQGLRELEVRRPDLGITDFVTPDMNGLELCDRIRDSSDVPIIMITGHHQKECAA